MNVAPTPFYLSGYYGGNNVMVLVMSNGDYEVRVTVQGGEIVSTKFKYRIYTDALRYKELQDLLIRRINRRIDALEG